MSALENLLFWRRQASNLMTIFLLYVQAQPTLLAFPAERPVFLREYSTKHYSVVSYFVSKFFFEAVITGLQCMLQCVISYLMIGFQCSFGMFYISVYALAMASTALAVFLGCATTNPKTAQEMVPLVFVPQMLFAGFFVAPSLIPFWLRWPQYLCTLTYSLRIVLVAEFYNCGSKDKNLDASMACNQILDNVGAKSDDTWWYWIVLVGLFLVFRLMALFVLKKKATQFL
jgi:ABC-type multidrug transport system permease subunit